MPNLNGKISKKKAREPGRIAGRSGKRSGGRRSTSRTGELDLADLAAAGKLAAAGSDAARDHLAAGLPVTYQRRGKLIREFPDGREEVIGDVPRNVRYRLPKTVRPIRSA